MREAIDTSSDAVEIPNNWIYCKITGLGQVTHPKNLTALQEKLRCYIIVKPKENAVILCRRKNTENAPGVWTFLTQAKQTGAVIEFTTDTTPEYEEIDIMPL